MFIVSGILGRLVIFISHKSRGFVTHRSEQVTILVVVELQSISNSENKMARDAMLPSDICTVDLKKENCIEKS